MLSLISKKNYWAECKAVEESKSNDFKMSVFIDEHLEQDSHSLQYSLSSLSCNVSHEIEAKIIRL